MTIELEPELDQIFALPPGQFTSARNQLEKRLKAAGQGGDAKAVKALPKPKLTAWLVNWLALKQPQALSELRTVGQALASAQSAGGAAELAKASQARRAQVKQLLSLAAAACDEHGERLPPAAERELTTSLETLAGRSVDPPGELPGRLSQPLVAAGFDAFGVFGAATPVADPTAASAPPKAPAKPAKPAPPVAQVESAEERAARERKLRLEQLEQAQAMAAEVERRGAEARAGVESVEQQCAEKRAALLELEAQVARAEAALAELNTERDRAKRALEQTEQTLKSRVHTLRQAVEQHASAAQLVAQLEAALDPKS